MVDLLSTLITQSMMCAGQEENVTVVHLTLLTFYHILESRILCHQLCKRQN